MCKKMPFSYTNFQKSPYRGRGKTPLPHPPPARSLRSIALPPPPPLTNPGCTTVTGIGTQAPTPPPIYWSYNGILNELHWLPVEKRIIFKLLNMAYKCNQGVAPQYLLDIVKSYQPARNLSIILN